MRGLRGFFFSVTCLSFVMAATAEAQDACPSNAGPDCIEQGSASEEERDRGELPWRRLQLEQERERPPDFDDVAPPERWYGWQTLTVDGLSIALVGVSAVADAPALALVSLGMWLLGAPVVHLANGNGRPAAISFGIRLGSGLVVFAGLAIALSQAFDDSASSSSGELPLGLGISLIGTAGMLAAMALDPSVFAFTKPGPNDERALRVLPFIDPQRGRAGLRVALAL